MKRRKILTLLLAALLTAALSSPALAVAETGDPVEMEAARQALTADAEFLLDCENGEFPDDISVCDTCEALMKFDPELAEAVYEHIEEISVPVEDLGGLPEAVSRSAADGPRREGTYMRDGDGGYFVYEDFLEEEDDATVADSPWELEQPDWDAPMSIVPYSFNDFTAVPNPRGNRYTSTVCRIEVKVHGTWKYGSGFFVGNRVVATAGHVLYDNWSGNLAYEWIDEGYVVQAYAPGQTTEKPFGRKQIDNKDMGVGADWKTLHTYDSDWGIVVLKSGTMGGSYPYLTKRQISVDNFIGQNITTYGYPYTIEIKDGEEVGYAHPMFKVSGKASAKPNNLDQSTYRVLFSTGTDGGDASLFHGMSGGPVLDASGNVIAINTGLTDSTPKCGTAVSLDKWLYPKLKAYE